MVATSVILVLAHIRHRKQRNAEIRDYYREQLEFVIMICLCCLEVLNSRSDTVDLSSYFTRPQPKHRLHPSTRSTIPKLRSNDSPKVHS